MSGFRKCLARLLMLTLGVWAGNGFAQSLQEVMKARGLTEKDIVSAAKTYTPSGVHDEYVVFSSGGPSGQVIAYGVPSMRIVKYIAVFTPEPWQGYGLGDTESTAVLASGKIDGRQMTWGDTHHPALSETNGRYDGEFLFIDDRANPRIAVIDLKTFSTVQIVVNPVMMSSHGGAFVTPNTEYILEATQYAAPLDRKFAPLDRYDEKYRGAMTFWKFDRTKGRIDPARSFSIELPPYWQDLADAGKLVSDGWAFANSFNSERYRGGVGKGNHGTYKDRAPFEVGTSDSDTDYLHLINSKAVEALFKQGKAHKIHGHPVIPMGELVKANALVLVPESKSPHGVDVSPDGRYVIVAGKLDTLTSVYDFAKMKALAEAKDFAGKDSYGIPVLDFKKSLYGQVELGLGAMHTQFDSAKGIAYTSLFADSAVARWDYVNLKLIEKVPVQYNPEFIVTAEGDTVRPGGRYLIALNTLALDRFTPVGPLHPQNHQLIDITEGRPMQPIYDMPQGLGEPHSAVMIKADKLKPVNRFVRPSFPDAVEPGTERIERNGNQVTIHMTAIRSHFDPEIIEVKAGDEVTWHITNLERAEDETHGFTVDTLNLNASLEPGKTDTFRFKATKEGVYPFYCTEFCSALHLEMAGYLLVKP